MSVVDDGIAVIADAVSKSPSPSVVIEMTRQLGDILHSTIVVRHVRKTEPNAHVVWAIGEQYAQIFSTFGPELLGPHAIAPMPTLPAYPHDRDARVAWVRRSRALPGVRRAFGCGVHPWGWKRGSIVDAVLVNAGIGKLSVPRRPFLPILASDRMAADDFLLKHAIKSPYVALEYESYSLGTQAIAWFAEFVKLLRGIPVIALAAASAKPILGAIDGRGTPIRVTKSLIARSGCFVGVGSGLSVLAAATDQPTIECVEPSLSMPAIGYRPSVNAHGQSPRAVGRLVRARISGEPLPPSTPSGRLKLPPRLRPKGR